MNRRWKRTPRAQELLSSLVNGSLSPTHPNLMDAHLREIVHHAQYVVADCCVVSPIESPFESRMTPPGENIISLLRMIIESVSSKQRPGLEERIRETLNKMHAAAQQRLRILRESPNVVMTAGAIREIVRSVEWHLRLDVEKGLVHTDNKNLRRALIDASLDFGLALDDFVRTLGAEGRIVSYAQPQDLEELSTQLQCSTTDVEAVYVALSRGVRRVAIMTYDADFIRVASYLHEADIQRRNRRPSVLRRRHPFREKKTFLGIRAVTCTGRIAENIGFSFGGAQPYL